MTTKIHGDGERWTSRIDLLTTDPVTLVLPVADEATIAISVPAGGSVTVEFSASSVADINANDALFFKAEGIGAGGVVVASMLDLIPGPVTAVRATASVAGGRVEILQGA